MAILLGMWGNIKHRIYFLLKDLHCRYPLTTGMYVATITFVLAVLYIYGLGWFIVPVVVHVGALNIQ